MRDGVLLVAAREITEKVRDRAFLIFTAFMLLLPIVGGAVGGFLAEPEASEYTVGLAGEGSDRLGVVLEQQAPSFGAEVRQEALSGPAVAERAVRSGELDAAVVDGDRLIADGRPSPDLEALLQAGAQRARAAEVLQASGVDPARTRGVLDPAPLAFESVGGGEAGGGYGSKAVVAQIGMVFLFVAIFTYGYWIANGVVEEKSSRVVEVVLSTISPSRLLAGKILGIGLLGLGQIVLVLALGLVALPAAGLALPPAAIGILGAVALWFVLGFALYACLFAVAGSLVSRQEDLQYTQMPIMVLIFVGYGTAFYEFGSPGSAVAQVLSFVPPFSPMVMLMRMGTGEAGALEVGAAALISLASVVALVALAARLYAGSVLRFGARVPLREAWRTSGAR